MRASRPPTSSEAYRRLVRADHDDPFDPWLRYAGTDIRFINNPIWTDSERADLDRYDLIA
jgi:hypothetical protein